MSDPYLTSAVDAAARGPLSASCLAPSELAALRARGTHGLPIDLVEPAPARAGGDRVPCHLFMPEVAWHEPFAVIRKRPRRDLWLRVRQPWPPERVGFEPLEPPGLHAAVLLVVASWVIAAGLVAFGSLL